MMHKELGAEFSVFEVLGILKQLRSNRVAEQDLIRNEYFKSAYDVFLYLTGLVGFVNPYL